MNPIGEKDDDKIFISVRPHHCPRVSCVTKRVEGELVSTWGMRLDGHGVPSQSPPIVIRQPINPSIEQLYHLLTVHSLACHGSPFIEMNLHILQQISSNGKNTRMPSNPTKQVRRRIMHLPSDHSFPLNRIFSRNNIGEMLMMWQVSGIMDLHSFQIITYNIIQLPTHFSLTNLPQQNKP